MIIPYPGRWVDYALEAPMGVLVTKIISLLLLTLFAIYQQLVVWMNKFYYRNVRAHVEVLRTTIEAIRCFGLVKPARLNQAGASSKLDHLALLVDASDRCAVVENIGFFEHGFSKTLVEFALFNRIPFITILIDLSHIATTAAPIGPMDLLISMFANVSAVELHVNNEKHLINSTIASPKSNSKNRVNVNLIFTNQRQYMVEKLDELVANGIKSVTVESLSETLTSQFPPIDLIISNQPRLNLSMALPWNIGFSQFSLQPGAILDRDLLRSASVEYISSKQNYGK